MSFRRLPVPGERSGLRFGGGMWCLPGDCGFTMIRRCGAGDDGLNDGIAHTAEEKRGQVTIKAKMK